MKAIVYEKYGSPDVLGLVEVEKPHPKENEVLIKVVSASPNAADYRSMKMKIIPKINRIRNFTFHSQRVMIV